jgi:uncharacterized membrane protein YdjX (TVP38/TMEM64 family)
LRRAGDPAHCLGGSPARTSEWLAGSLRGPGGQCLPRFWLAARWLRQPIEKLLAARGHRIPTLAGEDETKFIFLCRLTPGVPLTVQNYLLGGARVHFGRYLLFSLPVQWAWGVAFVIFGNSLTRSSVWRVLLAGCLLVALWLLISLDR